MQKPAIKERVASDSLNSKYNASQNRGKEFDFGFSPMQDKERNHLHKNCVIAEFIFQTKEHITSPQELPTKHIYHNAEFIQKEQVQIRFQFRAALRIRTGEILRSGYNPYNGQHNGKENKKGNESEFFVTQRKAIVFKFPFQYKFNRYGRKDKHKQSIGEQPVDSGHQSISAYMFIIEHWCSIHNRNKYNNGDRDKDITCFKVECFYFGQ